MAFAASIVVFVVALVAIIMIHELGHYLVARGFGFRVLEYFVGFGPRLWSYRRGEIEYGVKAIPAGGYVKIAGMNPLEDDVPPGDEQRAYYAKPVWQRALVILAGPASHFVVAIAIFSTYFLLVGRPDPDSPWRISTVQTRLGDEASPAYVAGIEPGDVIVRIGAVQDPTSDQITRVFSDAIGEAVVVGVMRDGRPVQVTVTPVEVVEEGRALGRIGVGIEPSEIERLGLLAAIGEGSIQTWDLGVESVRNIGHVFGPAGIGRTFGQLFSDEPRAETDAQSVYGVTRTFGSVGAAGDWATFLFLFGYVTLFIGLVNLIPLPPFDGGHLAVLAIEKIRGRRVDPRSLIPVSAAVLTFFVLFTVATVALDIWKPVPIAP